MRIEVCITSVRANGLYEYTFADDIKKKSQMRWQKLHRPDFMTQELMETGGHERQAPRVLHAGGWLV